MAWTNGADRLPPHSEEMERGVLGCILLNPATTLNQCLEKLKTGPEVFYDLRHQEIYRAIVELNEKSIGVDELTLFQKLKEKNLEKKIGVEFLSSLHDAVPSAANLDYYLDSVLEKWKRRRVVQLCAEISQKAYESDGSADDLIGEVEQSVISMGRSETQTTLDGKMAGDRMSFDLQKRMELEGRLSGLDCGLLDLNRMTEGLQFGEQCVIGARPSQGKTAMGLGIFRHSVFNGIPALFVSLEMSVESVMRRLLSAHLSIPLQDVKRGKYSKEDFGKVAAFHALCRRSPMYFIDGVDGCGIRQMTSRIRRHVLQHGIKLVVIDYLQKIRPSAKHEKRTYEVGEVSERLKALADETKVAMVTLAQLNRDSVKQNGRQTERAPRLSDLADSGQIERDADLVGLIYRKDGNSSLIVAKQRDGEVGMIKLFFNGPYCRFENFTNQKEP